MKVALFAACALTGCLPEHCDTYYQSEQTYARVAAASGQDLVSVTWRGPSNAISATLVSPAGVATQEVQLPASFATATLAATGHASAIWMLVDSDRQLEAAVVSDHDVQLSTIAAVDGEYDEQVQASVVFDGTAYQVFWLANRRLEHATLSEQASLSPSEDLGAAGAYSVFAVTDGAGKVYVALGEPSGAHVLAFDPAMPAIRELATSADAHGDQAFWFAGELHLRDHTYTDTLYSFDPTTSRWRTRTLPAEVAGGDVFASPLALYGQREAAYQLDANLVPTRLGVGGISGTFGADWLEYERVANCCNAPTTMPGRLELERGNGNTPAWATPIAIDSPIVMSTECGEGLPSQYD